MENVAYTGEVPYTASGRRGCYEMPISVIEYLDKSNPIDPLVMLLNETTSMTFGLVGRQVQC